MCACNTVQVVMAVVTVIGGWLVGFGGSLSLCVCVYSSYISLK